MVYDRPTEYYEVIHFKVNQIGLKQNAISDVEIVTEMLRR